MELCFHTFGFYTLIPKLRMLFILEVLGNVMSSSLNKTRRTPVGRANLNSSVSHEALYWGETDTYLILFDHSVSLNILRPMLLPTNRYLSTGFEYRSSGFKPDTIRTKLQEVGPLFAVRKILEFFFPPVTIEIALNLEPSATHPDNY